MAQTFTILQTLNSSFDVTVGTGKATGMTIVPPTNGSVSVYGSCDQTNWSLLKLRSVSSDADTTVVSNEGNYFIDSTTQFLQVRTIAGGTADGSLTLYSDAITTNDYTVVLSEIETNTGAADTKLATVNSNLTTVNSNLTSVNSNLTTANSNLTSVDTKLATVNSNLTTVNSNLTSVDTKLATVNSNLTTANSNLTTVNSNLTTVNSNLTSVDSNLTAVNNVLQDQTNFLKTQTGFSGLTMPQNLIYRSNYHTSSSIPSILSDYEAATLNNSSIVGLSSGGLRMTHTTNASPRSLLLQTYHIPFRGGKNLYVYGINNVQESLAQTINTTFKFGLTSKSYGQIFIEVPSSGDMSVTVEGRSEATTTIIGTQVSMSSWNIDPLDGTGPSGLTWADWTTAKFFIYTDNQSIFVFGIVHHENYIMCHYVNRNTVHANSSVGVEFGVYRPFFLSESDPGDEVQYIFRGFAVYSDTTPQNFPSWRSGTESSSATIITEFPETPLALALPLTDEIRGYVGTAQLGMLSIYCDNPIELQVYVSLVGDIPTYTGVGHRLGYYKPSLLSSSTIIYSQVMSDGVTAVNLQDHISSDVFGYGINWNQTNAVIIAVRRLNPVITTVELSQSYKLF